VREGEAIETAAFSEGLYGDTRYKVLQIPAAQPGNVIGYEYQQKQRPFILQTAWSFQDEIPVRQARFTLELPSTWKYTVYWRNHAPVSPQQRGENRWLWEIANIDAVSSEPASSNCATSAAFRMPSSFVPECRALAPASASPERSSGFSPNKSGGVSRTFSHKSKIRTASALHSQFQLK